MNETSRKKLSTCDDRLVRLITETDKRVPLQVIYGERDEASQNEAFKKGYSKLKYPESKHNVNKAAGRFKSHAVDIIPDPDHNPATVDWKNIHEFEIMLLVVEQVADELGIPVQLGRDFRHFPDLPHVELI